MQPVNPPCPGRIIASRSGTAYSIRQAWLISQLTSISEGLSPIRHPWTRLVGDGRPIPGNMPRKVQGATYADDLVLWCSEEHLSTAKYRLQQALNTLEGWTKRWLVRINPRKTTYTIFSLSTKEQKATLHINGQTR